MRGGRKGGLPVCEYNGLLAKEKSRSPNNNGKKTSDDVPAMPKQFIGQAAIDEQQSSMVFSEGGFLWGQQSMSSMEDDMWSIGLDMDEMSVDFAPTAALAMVGRRATDRASKCTRMARPSRMNGPLSTLCCDAQQKMQAA
jgi:hypothetical protein